ncbi:PIG-L deacetylase family protein [Rhodococcus sp. LB1]|uniref:PIG-L deacetylase family protein n=1 Tax=Rhodococcus sp. LB1 TaxID=1807499 RepID=UPI000A97CD8B|nr:PIG-L family deacetylase [Rhodococcus sp. LB1]
MTSRSSKSIVVLSAHSGDFVWRGGAISLAAEAGADVRVVCLSFGERGESQGLWADPNMPLETVKIARQKEAAAAAEILGAWPSRTSY